MWEVVEDILGENMGEQQENYIFLMKTNIFSGFIERQRSQPTLWCKEMDQQLKASEQFYSDFLSSLHMPNIQQQNTCHRNKTGSKNVLVLHGNFSGNPPKHFEA